MLQALYDFFRSLFNFCFSNGNYLSNYQVWINTGERVVNGETTHYGVELSLTDYFSFLCSIISLILIIVLCCLFVWKIIKLVGNLIK